MDEQVALIEHACAVFENPSNQAALQEASATLLAFRNSDAPIDVCQLVLQSSSSEQAKFQAAVTLRDAAVRQWAIMSRADQRALRGYVLHYVLRHTSKHSDLVQKQLTGTVAVLLKRGWVDESSEERHAFFSEIESIVAGTSDAAARRTGIEILEAVVSEFAPATASPLGLAWEQHDRCRQSLQQDNLHTFYQHAATIAGETAQAATQGQDQGVCSACLSLMAAVLTWDFRPGNGHAAYLGTRPTSDSLQVQPGPSWRGLLLGRDRCPWLHPLLAHLHNQPDSVLAQRARQLVVLLCSLTGDIFPKEQHSQQQAGSSSSMRNEHLRQMLQMVWVWVPEPQAAVHQAAANEEAFLLDACRALNAAASVHRLSGFETAAPGDGTNPGILAHLASLTQACIGAGGLEQGNEGGWATDAVDILLDAWVELLQVTSARGQGSGGPVSGRAHAAVGAVFQALLEAALRDAAAGAFEDEEEDEGKGGAGSARDEWLTRVAVLGQAAPLLALPLLSNLIAHRQQQMADSMTGKEDGSVAMEELCLVLRLAAHVLADPGEGETPLMPLSMAHASTASVFAGQADVVEATSNALLGVASMSLDPSLGPIMSPRVMEAAVWAIGRWADTYLLSEEDLSPAMGQAFGPAGNGPSVLAVLVQMAGTILGGQAGEVELHTAVCTRLLSVLVRRRHVSHRLVQLQPWHNLAGAFAQQAAALTGLSAKVQRALACCLCQAATGLPDNAQRDQYINHLLQNIAGEVSSLASRADLASIAERPDVMQRVTALLECLRGAAQGTSPDAQQPLFSVCACVMEPLLVLQKAYRQHESVVCLLLKLAGDVVEAHVSYLPAGDAHIMCHWVLHILQTYSSYNKGRRSVQTAAALRQDAVGESYRDLRALLKLLTHLTQRDLIDFGSTEEDSTAAAANGAGQAVDVAQLVFLGLDILIPLISLELLGYPKLCLLYFQLLAYMMEVYPEKVAALPSQQLQTLLHTLEVGIASSEPEAVQSALEALAALAKFDYQSKQAGKPGLQAGSGEGLLSRFLEVLMRRLLLDSGAGELTGQAADALLPLILAHPQAYQHIGEQLLAEQKNEGLRSVLTSALTKVMSANGLCYSLDRNNKKVFRDNLGAFVVDARSIVRVR
ncbi:TPA: hypothetical protein ACH3X1_004612 [Trebouxia sp. C0004]